jgi:ParB family chromosome partitioning protein
MQPVVARPSAGGRFELVAGERRLRGARRAGLGSIPVVVRELSDEESAELCLVENVQREDLNPIERANAFAMLARRFSLTHAEIGERVGLERSTVSNFVRLLELDDELRSLVAEGTLTLGHAKALLGAPGGDGRSSLGRRAVAGSWSVRRLERAVAEIAGRGPSPDKDQTAPQSSNLADLERQLGDHLGTRVRIRADSKGTRGRVEISFYDLDHFDGLMSRLGFEMR